MVHGVIVNRRPLLGRLADWIAQSGATVSVIVARSSVTSEHELSILRSRCRELVVVDDYDAPSVEPLILRTCASTGASVLISTTETDVIRCARVREALGISGQSMASALAYRDKLVMKSLAAAAGCAVVPAACGSDAAALEALVREGRPLVLKPRRGVASKGIARFEQPERVLEAIEPSMADDVLVEPFVHAAMAHVDGLMLDGALYHAWPSRYLYPQWQTRHLGKPSISGQMSPDDPLLPPLLDATASVIASLPAVAGLSAFHAEYFIGPSGVTLCEIASRAGGAGIAESYEASFGTSLYGAPVVQQLTGGALPPCASVPPGTRHGWAWLLPRAGTLVRAPRSCALPGVVEFRSTMRAGDTFTAPHPETQPVMEIVFDIEGPVLERLHAFDAWWHEHIEWA
ncbi:ATP-grasp domain-containing protein [Paraliomyxa miuraensis]|uniref:ATP-grasp domain-containing protein n=1 Tax=Paraliomyxa miuraensis TaxID=376150 RepID=UPI002255B95E|nr:hypothetical protein [Paraliomyxa miuraensis]MCX4245224.1 hypothetical protein [Paraliomyxa miuraensis]